MDLVRPHEHWPGTVAPLLAALAPRAVWVPGSDALSAAARAGAAELGYALGADPDETTDAAIISGDPNFYRVSTWLAAAAAPGVGGELGAPVVIVGASGWPHATRDGYRDPDAIPPERRRSYARCLPAPDEVWLTPWPAPLASALESGGAENGVAPALDGLLEAGGWQVRFAGGFGGLAILAPEDRLRAAEALRAWWDRAAAGEAVQAIAQRLDVTLARSVIDAARLREELAEEQSAGGELRSRLADAIAELDRELDDEEQALRRAAAGLERAQASMMMHGRQARTLSQRVTEAEALASSARTVLAEERLWVAQRARLIADSQAWRIGHRLARTARLLTFRRDRGTDAVQRIVARMEHGLESDRA